MTALIPPDLARLLVEHAEAWDAHKSDFRDQMRAAETSPPDEQRRREDASLILLGRRCVAEAALAAWTRAHLIDPAAYVAEVRRLVSAFADAIDGLHAYADDPGPEEYREARCQAAVDRHQSARRALLAFLGAGE